MSTIGKRLKALRSSKRWTLKEVASKLDLRNHSTYSNWEYDRTQPDADMLSRLANLYNVTVDYIVTGTNSESIDYEALDEKRKSLIEEIKTMTDEDIEHFHYFVTKKNKN